ncbi:universal stress protein [uncultured Methanomethylovorans sp.]|uniref:universal stress protein n=1 Tax=uncultured Methanomethylovorans sp. TaxID=183759 RepID=UPI002AA961DD|nr:universal stress protein [uncultured Methanomethylovorans sp.]
MTSTVQKILIATDGSDYSKNAIIQGMELAILVNAKVYVLYVLDKKAYAPPILKTSISLGSKWDVIEETLRQEGDEAIQYAKKIAEDKGVDIETVILEGAPAHTILEFAEQSKVNLIILGALGKGRFERFLLGSVADKVVKHSKISVLLVTDQIFNS